MCERWRYSTLIQWFKKFCQCYKNLINQVGLKLDSEAMLQAIEANLEYISQAWHLAIQCDSSSLQPWWKHLGWLNCTSHYLDIAKLLTCSSIYTQIKKMFYVIRDVITNERKQQNEIVSTCYSDNGIKLYQLWVQYIKVKLVSLVESDLKASISIATTRREGKVLLHSLDPCLIMLRVKQDSIKYHFLSLWYNSTWNWTLVSWTIGKHSTHLKFGVFAFMIIQLPCKQKFL